MLEKSFFAVYDKFKIEFFRSVFALVREREGSLSAMEAFSLEIIRELNEPTVGQFAEFLNISQSNATYKVASLIKKGYIVKANSDEDRREYHLILSDKYYSYIGLMQDYIATVTERIRERFPKEDVEKLASMLDIVANELMPESEEPLKA
ncbi:MAG: MarR family transcriptional regulator [Clostridia bacterium]|nr:MarR family transcriptional regulator [Clostridia bacterium]